MCGRFVSRIEAALERDWALNRPPPPFASFNVAPSMEVPVVRLDRAGGREAVLMRWGLIPRWAKDQRIGYRLINARAETLSAKPAFRLPFQQQRCLIPAQGFYEWRRTAHGKVPYYIHPTDESMLAFAGLWDGWQSPDGQRLRSCTIITTAATRRLAPLHDRMPAIVSRDAFETWLTGGVGAAQQLLRPCTTIELDAYPVSPFVNKPGHDTPRCVEPLGGRVGEHGTGAGESGLQDR